MAISVGAHPIGAAAQRTAQTPVKPQSQPSKAEASKTDLAPGLKQAAQLAAAPAAAATQVAGQAATQAIGALVNTKA